MIGCSILHCHSGGGDECHPSGEDGQGPPVPLVDELLPYWEGVMINEVGFVRVILATALVTVA
jgi:hypothetical protein